MIYAKAYLSGSVLVQKSLLELCNFQQGYAARVVPPELPEKERRRRSQAERLRETAFSACVVCHSPPLDEALGVRPDDLPAAGNAVTASDHRGAACSRLEKMVLSHDR